MKPNDHTKSLALPVDLEIRVTTPWGSRERSLEYVLNSPSGSINFYQTTIRGKQIHSPKDFQQQLFKQIEDLHRGRAFDGETVLKEEIFKDLTTIGHDLYQNLFPREMRNIYREFRDQVTTLLIVSDEPWIPWEILRPFEFEDDDFLCMKFQMSRWLVGETPLVFEKQINRLISIAPGDETLLTNAGEELEFLKDFAVQTPGIDGLFRSAAASRDVEEILEKTSFDLLHFVGHGKYDEQRPGEAKVILSDRAFRARQVPPAAEKKLRQERPMVFLNACQVGRLDRSLADLDGWAPRWVNRYCCSAFLAPFWSVNDERAFLFAKFFYEELKEGRTLGEAVLLARHKLRAEDPNEIAWLAYSLHGHPNARIIFGDYRPVITRKPSLVEAKPCPILPEDRSRANRSPLGAIPSSREPRAARQRRNLAIPDRSSRRRFLGLVAVVSLATLIVLSLILTEKWRESQEETAPSTPTQSEFDPEASVKQEPINDEGASESLREGSRTPSASGENGRSVEASRKAVPLLPIVSGKVGIVALDRTTRQPDADVTDAIETTLSSKINNIQPIVLQADVAYVEEFLGDRSNLPGGKLSPWGVEYFLIATSSRKNLPQANSPLEGVTLTLKTDLIDAGNSSKKLSISATHTGLGASDQEALNQATERCLKEITITLPEGVSHEGTT